MIAMTGGVIKVSNGLISNDIFSGRHGKNPDKVEKMYNTVVMEYIFNYSMIRYDLTMTGRSNAARHVKGKFGINDYESRSSGALMVYQNDTHLKTVGYILWLFGFTGSHRFYYGKPVTGTIWFFTLGLFLIGWIIDLFLIPSMDRQADFRYRSGDLNHTVAWILLTFLGLFGMHRFYMGKWFTGIVYLLSGGIFGIGYLYDLWTLNDQVSLINSNP
jgi:TM2 domain-containing membrane protein YozV